MPKIILVINGNVYISCNIIEYIYILMGEEVLGIYLLVLEQFRQGHRPKTLWYLYTSRTVYLLSHTSYNDAYDHTR